jgi:hypothetical protein
MTSWYSCDFGRRAFFAKKRRRRIGARGQELSSAGIERFYPAAVPLIARGADVLSDREKRPALIDWWSALPVTT